MAIIVPDGFELLAGTPIDSRFRFDTLVARDALPSVVRYTGLKCFVEETGAYYSLIGGVDNEDWIEDGSGAGDVTGPESSQAFELPKFADGTGKTLEGSGLISDGSGFLALNGLLAMGYSNMNADGVAPNDQIMVSINAPTQNIGGLVNPFIMTILLNNSGGEVLVVNEDTGVVEEQRILTGTGKNLKLKSGTALFVTYNDSLQRFQVVGGTGSGSAEPVIREVSANDTATEDDDILLVDTTSGDVEITLPAAYTKRLTVKKLVDDNELSILGDIDGQTNKYIYNAGNFVTLVKHNSEWYTV